MQHITFQQNTRLPHLCPVRAALGILQRAKILNIPSQAPVAVYWTADGTIYSITDHEINASFREAAKAVYNITTSKNSLDSPPTPSG